MTIDFRVMTMKMIDPFECFVQKLGLSCTDVFNRAFHTSFFYDIIFGKIFGGVYYF